ncbi:NAD(P)H dehydrogenase [Rhizobium sp. Leaf371]|uniref:NAD(P)H-dependent oxidoreductase n=1 Tax=unclassified Rhizobium TaxID=2613769 RepID=UPI0007148BC2|nr:MULTISPECIES: NAD(P)H-dependent oxidoreductase [unclassified Rhizobium]KQS71669.1 NAD(P)H dehydrogenase [Rhizobium sp. Leaf371]TCM50767.1 putative NADPH-quinone reductase [Rhizobium sp. PP-F2F-G48]
MARILLIHAHPVETSYSAQLRDVARKALEEQGHEIDLLSLYDEGFDAVLSREERLNYHDEAINITPAIAPYVARVRAADAIVLVHPVWNFGLPAILKGFFDRVFVPGVAFTLARGDKGKLVRILHNVQSVAVITTYGGPRFRAMLVGDPPRKVARRVLWAIFRPKKPVRYLALYNMNGNGVAELDAFKAKVAAAMSTFAAL